MREFFRLYLKSVSKKILFERKLKSEMKLSFCFSIFSQNRIFSLQNSQYFFELATLEINAIWRIHYFLWCCLNTTVCEFNNFNFGNYLAAQNGQANQVCSSKRYCNKIFFISAFICLRSSFLCQHGKKARKAYIMLLHMFLLLQEIY